MSRHVTLSLIDDDLIDEMNPILEYAEYDESVRELFSVPRVTELCDTLMEISGTDYDQEGDFHVLTPERVNEIIEQIELRLPEWNEHIQFKTNKFLTALKEQRDSFEFDGNDTLLLSWSD